MKKIMGIVVALCVIGSFVHVTSATTVVDSGTCGDNASWVLDSTGALTISGSGKMNAVELDEDSENDVTKIIINEGITEIGENAIRLYNNLTDVEMADSVHTIDDWNFYGHEMLKNIKLSEGLTEIGEYTFYENGDNFKEIFLPASVTKIGPSSFSGNNCLNISVSPANTHFSSMDGVLFNKDKTQMIKYAKDKQQPTYNIPNSVTNISSEAFRQCYYLTKLTLPNSIVSIDNAAFFECRRLKDISLPSSVTEVGEDIFFDCESLEKITIPNSITEIPFQMFIQCYNLKDVTIPNSIKAIGAEAFADCTSLSHIDLPNSITVIEDGAFEGSSIESITFPNSLLYIGMNVLSNTPIMKDKNNWENGMFYFQNYLLDIDFSIPVICEIKDGTKGISNGALFRFVDIKKITIPNSVEFIGEDSFGLLIYLTDIYYGGTEQQWESINISTEGNNPLWNAQIHFNSPSIPKPKIVGTPSVERLNNNVFSITVPLEDVEYNSQIIAILNYDDSLVGLNSAMLFDGDTSKTLTLTSDSATTAKIFIWDSLEGMRPLCEAKTVTVK